jgi:hypothetical protein
VSAPWLSVIVPTIGRSTLERTLRSIRLQAPASECEVLVVGDTLDDDFADALAPVPDLCARFDARYVGFAGTEHCVGQPQRQAGAELARGEWLWWLQDDDIATPEALTAIRAACRRSAFPHLFRVRTQWGFVVWQIKSLAVGNMDADGICVQNDPARLGHWGHTYQGDATFIIETVEQWGGRVEWEEALVAWARPDQYHDWTAGR